MSNLVLGATPGAGRDETPIAWTDSGGPPLGEVAPAQRESECRLAAAQIERALSPLDEVGAKVEHVYWANRGALTLLSWKRLLEGSGTRGDIVDGDRFTQRLWPVLCTYVGNVRGRVHLIHTREQTGWALSVNVETSVIQAPPREAKLLPVDAPDLPTATFTALEQAARRWRPLLRAPKDGWAKVEIQLEFEDFRFTGSSLLRSNSKGVAPSVELPHDMETRLAGAVIGFAEGLGARSVRVALEAIPTPGETEPRWRIREVSTLRPPGDATEDPFTTFTEYRLLHEEIMRQWRRDVRDTAVFAAQFTAEQAAIWVVGGWAAKGVGSVLKLAAGPLTRVLGRGGPEAAGWLETQLCRMPKAERDALVKLWTKVETSGAEALTAGERSELAAILRKIDEIAATPLEKAEKGRFWEIAENRFWTDVRRRKPALASRLVNGKLYPVHHRFPLEYAHFAPELDINSVSELVAIATDVHYDIGIVWTRFRSVKPKVTLADIKTVIEIVDRHFGRWYNTSYNSALEQARLLSARQAALAEVDTLIASIRSR